MKFVKAQGTSILYCPMNKKTLDFIDVKHNLTNDVFEVAGWDTEELCKEEIKTFDNPSEWTIVTKVTQVTIAE